MWLVILIPNVIYVYTIEREKICSRQTKLCTQLTCGQVQKLKENLNAT